MNKNYSSLTIGLIFILVGVGLLMDKMNLFDFGWKEIYPVIFILISIVSLINAFSGHKNSAFWGGVFAVLGAFFFLRNFDFIPFYWFSEFWPVILLALGIGFIALFVFQPKDWGVLIPGAILTGLGLIFSFEAMDLIEGFFEIAFDIVFTYWPLILILFGVGLILGSLRHKETRDQETVQE